MSLSRCLVGTAAAVLALSCAAQVMQAPGTMPGNMPGPMPGSMAGRHMPFPPRQGAPPAPGATPQSATPAQPTIHIGSTATAPSVPAAQPGAAPNLPPSLLDQPAHPAQVSMRDGSLSVDARNSSLSEILKNIQASTGMTVDGFDKDSRIFGIYGPGSPRDVLSELLDGAGYNFLMVGSANNGAPREIVLTARSNAPVSSASSGSSPQQDDEDDTPNYPPPQMVEPVQQPQAPMMPSSPDQQRPRTPQEMLLELQRLRQQQQQQQPGQQGQPPQ